MEEESQDLNLVTLLTIIILMIYTVSAPIFEKYIFIICMKVAFV